MSGGRRLMSKLYGAVVGAPGRWLTSVTCCVSRSRRNTLVPGPPVCPGRRLGALLWNATQRPSALTEGKEDEPKAVSDGGWLAGGREIGCNVDDSRQRSSSGSTAGRRGGVPGRRRGRRSGRTKSRSEKGPMGVLSSSGGRTTLFPGRGRRAGRGG